MSEEKKMKKRRTKKEAKNKQVKTEKKLTSKQLLILRLVYRFRFVTSKSIAAYFKQSYLRVARVQLNKLCERGYLGKRHNGSYRLRGRPAEYYLTPKATPLFRKELAEPSERELKQSYARPTASPRFVDCSLALLDIYLDLLRLYGERLKFATKPYINIERFDFFPRPLPDVFVTIERETGKARHFFLDYFDDGVSIGIHGRRIANYMKYKEDGEWDDTGVDFPTVIIVCQSPAMLKRAEKRTRYYENQEYSEISFRLIGLDSLKSLDSTRKKAWIDPIEKMKTTL